MPEQIKSFKALAAAMEPALAPQREAERREREARREAAERAEQERKAALRRLGVKVVA